MKHLNRSALDPGLAKIKPSATLAINELSNQLILEGKKVFKWGLGQSPFPVPEKVVEELRNRAFEKDYLPVRGLLPLREAVSTYYKQRMDLNYDPSNILIGPGSKELLFLVQKVFNGELLLPAPSWVSYEPQALLSHRSVQWIPSSFENGYLLEAFQLENILKKCESKPRALLLNYPNNPTGTSYTSTQLEDLGRVARKYDLLVISDEIYSEMNHQGNHVSIASYYPEGTILSSGLSKWCGAGGWRLGTFCFPPNLSWLADAISAVASETFTSVSAPIQWAAIAAFKFDSEIQNYVIQCRKVLYILADYIYIQMRDMQLRLPKPEGGFYVIVDFENYREKLSQQNICNSEELASRLLKETGIATLPGSVFGLPPEQLILRMSYVDFDGGKALKIVEKSSDPEKLAPRIVESLHCLRAWLMALKA